MDAPGGKAVSDLLPEQRRHRVPDKPVDDAAGLLRVHQVLVDLARVLERLADSRGSDLVESHTAELGLGDLDHVSQMPSDRLALAVEVSREPDVIRRLGLSAEEARLLLRIVRDDVLGLESLEVDPELRLRKIADMPEARLDLIGRTEHPF